MNRELDIIELYVAIDGACHAVSGGQKLRQRGPRPDLTDAEILTIEIFGEMQGHHDDASIWCYAKAHWQEWFPTLGSYKAFAKQCANLAHLKQLIFGHLFAPQDDIHITDGVPMPICHLARASHPFSCALRAGASYNYLLVNGERRLTPREMLRLQGFPDTFEFVCNDSQTRKQAGNSVPVPMIQAVLESLLNAYR